MPNSCEKYIDFINKNILPRIDYDTLQKSYGTKDRAYAKGVLNWLHQAMVHCYGSMVLRPDYSGDMEDNFVVIPGVVQGKKSGEFCLALLELDLSSSGEHWATDFLTEYGITPQRADENTRPELTALMARRFIPYDYCYTATIPNDIHVKHDLLPAQIKEFLRTFQDHTAELLLQAEHEATDPESFLDIEDEDDMEV